MASAVCGTQAMGSSYDQVVANSGVRKVCIIGGGVAGVVTARIFLNEGLDVTVLECTEQLGGVWAENYEGFGIQVPSALYEFPDEPLPKGSDFCSGHCIGNYIQQYAQKHGVMEVVQLNTRVIKIDTKVGRGYTLTTDQKGRVATHDFDLVIVATGVYGKQEKFIPEWQGVERFQGKIVHASDYLDLSVSQNKHVITVGYGKSAFDCAHISTKVAQSSTLLFREAHWCVPRKILGLVPFEYATFSRFGAAVLQPAFYASGPFEKLVHSIPGFLTGFWWLVSQIFRLQFGLPQECVPEKGFIADFWCAAGVLPHPDFFPLIRQGKIGATKGEIAEVKENSVILKSGEELPCDVLIAGTGYKPVRGFLPKDVADLKEKDGLWLYRQMIHPDHRDLVFVGSEVTTFTNITTPAIQARWLLELLAGRHKLPSVGDMKDQIAQMQEWKRSSMPNAGASRATMIQTHQVHYYDQLLKDMGASIRRKTGNVFAKSVKEIFDPYRPRDYELIVTGEFKRCVGESTLAGSPQSNFCMEAFLFLILVASVVGLGAALRAAELSAMVKAAVVVVLIVICLLSMFVSQMKGNPKSQYSLLSADAASPESSLSTPFAANTDPAYTTGTITDNRPCLLTAAGGALLPSDLVGK